MDTVSDIETLTNHDVKLIDLYDDQDDLSYDFDDQLDLQANFPDAFVWQDDFDDRESPFLNLDCSSLSLGTNISIDAMHSDPPNLETDYQITSDVYNEITFGFTDQAIQGGLAYYLNHPLQEFRYKAYLDQADLRAIQLRVDHSNANTLNLFFPSYPDTPQMLSVSSPCEKDDYTIAIDQAGGDIFAHDARSYQAIPFNDLNASRQPELSQDLDKVIDEILQKSYK